MRPRPLVAFCDLALGIRSSRPSGLLEVEHVFVEDGEAERLGLSSVVLLSILMSCLAPQPELTIQRSNFTLDLLTSVAPSPAFLYRYATTGHLKPCVALALW